jgi:hypothetical protein
MAVSKVPKIQTKGSQMTIAEMIGETPEMMLACGEVLKAEFTLNKWIERQKNGLICHEEIRVYRDILEENRIAVYALGN